MHKIVFKELEFRNFMSYGNTRNVFEFRDGLTWLSGDNGFGKSAIVEAMTFALLGVSYRGGKKEELRNTKNAADGAPTVVQLTFDTDNPQDGTESWRVTRSITGKTSTIKFTIEKLEGEDWVAQNKRAGFSQQDFEEKVLQFNEVLFKNVIAMNTQETLPFFMLPAAKKRELLESIISLSLDTWKKANHKRLSEATISFNVAQSDCNQLHSEIAELKVIHKRMLSERTENLAQMKADYAEYDNQFRELNKQFNELEEQKQQVQSKLTAHKKELNTESVVDARIYVINASFKNVPLLNDARKRLVEVQSSFDQLTEENRALLESIDDITSNHAEIVKNINSLTSQKHLKERDVSKKETEISMTKTRRDQLTEVANSFVVGTPCPTCGHISDETDVERHKAELRNQWTDLNNTIKTMKHELAELNDEISGIDAEIQNSNEKETELAEQIQQFDQFNKDTYLPAKNEVSAAAREVQRLERSLDGFDEAALTEELNSLNEKKAHFPEVREAYTELSEKYSEISKQQGELNGQIGQIGDTMEKLKADIEKAENSTDDSIAVMEGKINKNIEMYNDAVERTHTASDTIAICNTITKVCADDGMKKMVFSMFVPAFNKAVQRNITKAHLPFVVTFDDSMAYTFKTLPGLSPSYTMLSQGQKRKLGFAISMAFRDFVSLVGNFNVNFLSLDEVLDISTDDNSMRDMLDLAKLMLADIGCAVIITHRGKVVSDKFDFHQAVTNNGLYSMLGPIKPMWTKESAGEN